MEVHVKHLGDVQFEINARNHILISDQPEDSGGHDEGVTPPELFLAALGSCAAYYAAAYLKKKGIAQEGLEVSVKAEKAGPPARLDHFQIAVQVSASLSEADRGRIALPAG